MSGLYRRGAIWWRCYREGGKDYFESLRTTNYKAAKRLQAIKDAELVRRQPTTHRGEITLATGLRRYLDAQSPTHCPMWRDILTRQSHHLVRLLGNVNVQSLTPALIETALHRCQAERALSNSTRNKYRRLLVGLSRFALRQGWIVEDFMAGIPRLKEAPVNRVWLPRERWEELLALAKPTPYYPVIATALYTGFRRRTLLSLEWQDIDFSRHMIVARGETTKSGHPVTVPLHRDLEAILCPHRGPSGERCFPGISPQQSQRTLRGWLRQMGYRQRGLGFHTLRHSFGSVAVLRLPTLQVRDLMGHTSIRTTERYLHATPVSQKEFDAI